VQIAFEDGPIATYIQSFSSPIGVTETVFVGDRGALSVDYAGVSLFDRSNEPQPIQRWLNERYFGAHGEQKPESSYKCLDLLVQALRTDTEPENSGRDNLKTIALLDAAYVSSEEARVVALKSEVAE
jgi:predicted dehydrogenase